MWKDKFDTDFSNIRPPQWLQDFWEPIKESWEQVGGETIQAAKDALGGIWDLLKAIANTFLGIWNSPAGVEVLTKFHILLQTILGIIRDIAAAFITAWNSGTGEQVIQSLFFMLSSILDLLISIGQSFRDAWNDDGRGVAICNTILQIIRNIFNIVGNLASRLREAWEANGNGKAIWGAILDIVHVILSTIEKITKATADWASELNFEPLISAIRNFMESLVPFIQVIGDTLAEIWQNTVLPFLSWVIESALPAIFNGLAALMDWLVANEAVVKLLTEAVLAFIAAWGVMTVIRSIQAVIAALNPMNFAIQTIIAGIILLFTKCEGFREAVIETFKAIISILQRAIELAQDFFSALQGKGKYQKAVSNRGGMPYMAAARSLPASYSRSALLDSYPHLANGAVISPNNEFLAVLGDQRSGTNIEAPLSAITEAVKAAIGDMGGTGETVVKINYTGSLSQLARVLQPEITVETRRIGTNLVEA